MTSSIPHRLTQRLSAAGIAPSDSIILVDTSGQRLTLYGSAGTRSYPASTAQKGIGNREGSMQTPHGIHRIGEKIGAGAPKGRIFRDRKDTGCSWNGTAGEDNLILSRILWLEGLEPGVNAGSGIDSRERFIYIHGTDKEDRIGTPLSHGCVVMRNDDVIDLFDRVEAGTIVIID